MLFIGLDAHMRLFRLCILNSHGQIIKQPSITGYWPKLLTWLQTLQEQFAICYEASCGYGHLYDQLVQVAKRVVVAHPGQLRLIFRSKRKNDRVDAEKLARLLYLDQVPTVHVPSVEVRNWRALIEFRHGLVVRRTGVKNRLRALLRSQGLQPSPGKSLWTRRGLQWLAEVVFPAVSARFQREMLLTELGQLEEILKQTERKLEEISARVSIAPSTVLS